MASPEKSTQPLPKPTAEGLALATIISQIHLIPAAQIPLTLAVGEVLERVPPEAVAEAALFVFFATLLLSYLYEVDTLKKLGLSSNLFTVLAYFKIKNPELATALGDLVGQVVHSVNPIDIGFTATLFTSRDGGHLFFSNLISRAILTSAFSAGFNFALRRGHAEILIAKLHQLRVRFFEQIDQLPDQTGLNALDLTLFPLQMPEYPDQTSGDFPAWRPKRVVSDYVHYK